MKYAPLHDRVLVKMLPPAPTTPGGIIVEQNSHEAEVVAIGPEVDQRHIEVGDVVWLPKSDRYGDKLPDGTLLVPLAGIAAVVR